MPGKVIGTSLNFGFPGTIAMSAPHIVGSGSVKKDQEIMFGAAVTQGEDGVISNITASDTDIAGIAVRQVKSVFDYHNQNGIGTYRSCEQISIMEQGAISVICGYGAPKIGSNVYMRIAEGVGGVIIGQLEATAETDKNVLLPGMAWGSSKDANNVATLVIKTRKGV